MSPLLSSAVISAVGLTCKAFLNSGLCSITVNNLPILLDALRSERRNSGQGLVTVSNHLSTSASICISQHSAPYHLIQPRRSFDLGYTSLQELYKSAYYTMGSGCLRYHIYEPVSGAAILLATSAELPFWSGSLFSAFFRNGQVIETFRGDGIWQPALDTAIEKLNQGHWLHLFGEGKVHQPSRYPQTDVAHLLRFKWGVGRIIMETSVPPLIIPMWLTGFDKLMPEHRSFPHKFFPKLGVRLGVTFGDPIPPHTIIDALRGLDLSHNPPDIAEAFAQHDGPLDRSGVSSGLPNGGWMRDAIVRAGGDIIVGHGCAGCARTDTLRSEVTAVIQRAVEELGRTVLGERSDHHLPYRDEDQSTG